MIKSRAAVAFAPNEPLKIVEIDVEPPKAGEVLVRIVATGVCHTDAYTCLLYTSNCLEVTGICVIAWAASRCRCRDVVGVISNAC